MNWEDEEPEEPEDMSLAFIIGVGSYSIHTDGKKNTRYKKMDQIGFIRQKKNVSKVSSKNPAPRKRPTSKGVVVKKRPELKTIAKKIKSSKIHSLLRNWRLRICLIRQP